MGRHHDIRHGDVARSRPTERREVRSDDPSLTPEANRLLTDELRQAVGRDHVEVSADALQRSRERHGGGSGIGAALAANRLALIISFLVLITVGVIVSLATGSWWALVAAAAVHAVGTLATAASALQLTTQVEHVDPATAARLEAEGVDDPDRVLSDLVEDYADGEGAHGVAEVIASGSNANDADPVREPARSTVEQRTAMTPASGATRPAGDGSVIGLMPLTIVVGLVAISLVAAITEGGAMWVLPAIVWASAAAWLALTVRIDGGAEERAAAGGVGAGRTGGPGRPAGDVAIGLRTRIVPVSAVIVVGVIGFCILMGLAAGAL